MELKPGQVWWGRPDAATVGREQAGRRPVLIVSSEDYLATVTTLVLVVPLTSTDRGWPNHVPIRGGVALTAPSFAMTEQPRAISRERLVDLVGEVDPACLTAVRSWIVDFLTD